MKSTIFIYFPGYSMMMILYLVLLVCYARSQGEEVPDTQAESGEESHSRSMGSFERVFGRSLHAEDPFGRSLGARYIGNGMHLKTGWRPVMTSGPPSFVGDVGHKLYTGPAFIESKAYNVPSFGSSGFGSTSSRPLNTRDVNKLSSIAQTYKPSVFPQNSVNLNAPVNSYLNPFAITSNAGLNSYKMSPNFHFDNNIFLKQATSHRPLYTKQPQQLMLGLRVKPNQYQISQQHPVPNQFHQQFPSFQQQLNIKKPIESYSRPFENFNHVYKPSEHVNPQESLNKQTQQNKIHPSQGVQAVTYKPHLSARFPQFGVNEDSFAPIPSSILGSFSSFGHASVKARDPPQFGVKTQYHSAEPTKTPEFSTVTKDYIGSSTIKSEIKQHNQKDSKPASSILQNHKGKDDFKDSLVPPPKINFGQNYNNPSTERIQPHRDNFIPSPVDPLTRGQADKQKHSNAKRPVVSSFFDSNLQSVSPSTISPFESHTHAVPDNLLVQLPPPHSQFGNSQSNKNYKDKHHSFVTQSVTHNAVTTKYSIFDDVPQFSNDGYKSTSPRPSFQNSYEVTEGWEPFGEEGTQSSITSWGNPSQTFKQYTSILGPPKGLNKVVSTYYPPQASTIHPDLNEYGDISTVYSISDGNRHHELHNAENSITSPDPQDYENSEQSNKQVVISPSPNYININTDKPRVTTTDSYQETTTASSILNRRKPSRYRPHHETTTEDFNEVTTQFETYKQNVQGSENDLNNELPTIPPNKHFKRPLLATTTSYPEIDDKLKKKLLNKNRRRRPYKPSTTTTEDTNEEITTESIFKTRTTTYSPETEETTKIPRNRLRFPQKARPTRPSVQPELTSSAQPTVIPTHPITLRPKLHSRIRTTTQSSLDFIDEVTETTTIKEKHQKFREKQSSIMKIAKDSTQYRPSVLKYSSSFGGSNDAPDYTHKQDEKDTPTSDVSQHLSSHKYQVQNEDNLSFSDLFLSLDSEIQQSAQDTYVSPTFASEPVEPTEPQVTEPTFNDDKNENNKGDEPNPTKEINVSPTEGETSKKSKLYGNRPRFSVKDYRNRLNQYTSSTTEKSIQPATETSPRIRFPNRSRFSNLKDGHDSKTSASDVSNATEQPRKKFVPKDKTSEGDKGVIPLAQQKTNSSDNEFLSKANNKFRSSLRKDKPIITTIIPDVTEKAKATSGVKRPSIVRKRLPTPNKPETTVETITEVPTTTEKMEFEKFEPIVENVTSSTEKSTSETAIMKIAKEDKKHSSTEGPYIDPSQRVSDLTLASSKDYDTPGMFKSVSPNARRVVPNYFTIATDDPILPIEAFFPQLNQKKDS